MNDEAGKMPARPGNKLTAAIPQSRLVVILSAA